MEFVKQKYTILEQEIPALKLDDYSHSHFREEYMNNMYKHIERCGRVCYRSENRITDGSAERFVKGLIKTKHYSVLEHGTVYLDYPSNEKETLEFYKINPYSKLYINKKGNFSITTNYRVIIENNRESDLKYLTVPDEYYHIRHTVLMTTCIQVYKELTRQRYLSPSIESTRYCNYSVTSKFGDMKFVVAPWFKYIKEGKVILKEENNWKFQIGCTKENPEGSVFELQHTTEDSLPEFKLLRHLLRGEGDYRELIELYNWKPEEAAYILPQGLAAEAVFTGYDDYWDYVFDLRARDKTGKAHPLVKEIMIPLSKEFEERGWIEKYT